MDSLLGHHHSHSESPIHRMPAIVKLGFAFGIIIVTVLTPIEQTGWFVGAGALLVAAALLSRLPILFLAKRILVLSPFVLGVAVLNAFEPSMRGTWVGVAVKSAICLFTVILVSNTTPFSKILHVLKMVRVPGLLITTIALMHRYLFVLADEAERMRRARASRTFARGRRFQWRGSASVVGQLFVRASERAERIYDAMCARGWK